MNDMRIGRIWLLVAFPVILPGLLFVGCKPESAPPDAGVRNSLRLITPHPSARAISLQEIEQFAAEGKGYAAAMERFGEEGFVPASIPALAYPATEGGYYYVIFGPGPNRNDQRLDAVIHYPDAVYVFPASQRGKPLQSD